MVTVNCEICGKEMKLKPSHVKKRRTCSRECSATQRREWMKGKGNHQYGLKGDLNSSHKECKTIQGGYVYIYLPTHPRSDESGRIREHIVVAEKHLNIPQEFLDDDGYIKLGIEVHHRNEDTTDNRPDNLQVLTKAEHRSLHNKQHVIVRGELGRITGVVKPGELLEA